MFIGRTDAEAPMLWPPDVKPWLIEKVRDERNKEVNLTAALSGRLALMLCVRA